MLLAGTQLREATSALEQLSDAFLALRTSTVSSPSLANGQASLALVHAGLDSAFPGKGHLRAAETALRKAATGVASCTLTAALHSGFVGVAWAVELIAGDPSAESDANAQIDSVLESHLTERRGRWKKAYDLIGGLVGIGVYALERMPRASAKRLVRLVVRHLAQTAVQTEQGTTWWTDPTWVTPEYRQNPHPAYNLGLAHGVPGVIGFLGSVLGSEVSAPTRRAALTLLRGAVRWLCAQELPADADSSFDVAVGPGFPRTPARLAWCYGDLGVAAALLLAARGAEERGWEDFAMRVAIKAARRPLDRCEVIDTGLCHGAIGNAHVFHRLFLTTGEAHLADAARAWFERALSMRVRGRSFAGFRAYVPNAAGKLTWQADRSFLTGGVGIALALAAAVAHEPDPAWDRALLVS